MEVAKIETFSDYQMDEQAPGLSKVRQEAFFPTMVFNCDIEDADGFNASLIESINAEKAKDEAGLHRSNVPKLGGWHSHNNLHQLNNFSGLRDAIHKAAAVLGERLGYDNNYPLTIDQMWSIINPPGSFNKSHIHPGYLWSGVYYVQTPKNSGGISFTDPRTTNLMMTPKYAKGKRPKESWTSVNYDPIAGRMLIFPAWMYHAVALNEATKSADQDEVDRICVAFNLVQDVIN